MAALSRPEASSRPVPDAPATHVGASSSPSAQPNPALSSLLRRPSAPPGPSPPNAASTGPLPSSTPNAGGGPTNEDIEAVIKMAMASSASRPATQQRDTRTQLFVGNLPYRVRWQDLKDLFRRAGTVLRADVSLGPDNRSRGFGTVLLASAEDAGRAVDMFNGYCWQTRTLEVRPDRMDDHAGSGAGTPAAAPLPATAAAALAGLHAPAPLARLSSVPAAVYAGLLGGEEGAALSRPSTGAGGAAGVGVSRNLFVGNLPFHIQWQDLKDLFRQAGAVQRADVALGADGRSRGFGTVSFATETDAERAVRMFNGFEYNGRALKVHYDKFSAPASTALPAASVPNTPTALALAQAHAQAQAEAHAQAHAHAFSHPLVHAASFAQRVLQYQHDQRWQQEQSVAQLLSTGFRQNTPLDAGSVFAGETGTADRGGSEERQPPGSLSLDSETISSHSPRSQHYPQLTHLDLNHQQYHHQHSHTHPSHIPISYPSPYAFDFLHSGPSSPYEFYGSTTGYMPQYAIDQAQSHGQKHAEFADGNVPEPIVSPATSIRTAVTAGPAAPTASQAETKATAPGPSSQSQPQPQASTTPSPTESQNQVPHQSNGTQSHTPHQHPAHPGPIALPPPPPVTAFPVPPSHTLSPAAYHFSPIMSGPISPLHAPPHMMGTPYAVALTPHGLPPVTPSMPSFTFVPQHTPGGEPAHNAPPPAFDPARALPPHLLSPYSPFSPGVTMSPGAFWGRPGPPANPYINPAPGAPVHAQQPPGPDGQQPPAWGGAAAFYAYARGRGHAQGVQDEYFPPVPVSMAMAQGGVPAEDAEQQQQQAREAGYFPLVPPGSAQRLSGLANELARDGDSNGSEGSAGGDQGARESGASTAGTGRTNGTAESVKTSPSSRGTSWHESDAPLPSKEAVLELANGLEALVLDGEADGAGKRLHPRAHSDQAHADGAPQLLVHVPRADSDPVRIVACGDAPGANS